MTSQTVEHASLAAALAAFQSEIPPVKKNKTAKIEGGQGKRSYSYTYADLVDVTDAAMPVLSRHGLSFVSIPKRTENGSYELVGTLLHTSGQEKTGELPLMGRTAQELGSAMTYMRRYLLCSMTGIVADEDDDGTRAQAAEQRTKVEPGPLEVMTQRVRQSWNNVEALRILLGQIGDQGMSDVEVNGPQGPEALGVLVNDRITWHEHQTPAGDAPGDPGPETPPDAAMANDRDASGGNADAAERLRQAAQARQGGQS